jgi:hypothetical protein
MRVGQNWNGVTDTDILPSDNCWTVKLISFEAFVSPTITDIDPLHVSARLSALVDVVTIFSPRRYNGRCDFSASELASLEFAIVEFLAAYLPSALLWSSETVLSTASRVSKESHSGFALQPLRKIMKGKLQKTIDRLRKYDIEVPHAFTWLSLVGNRFEGALFQVRSSAVEAIRLSWRSRKYLLATRGISRPVKLICLATENRMGCRNPPDDRGNYGYSADQGRSGIVSHLRPNDRRLHANARIPWVSLR